MARARTAYVCSECGAEHNKWQGQCAECGVWNTLAEFVVQPATKSGAANPRGGYAGAVDAPKVTQLATVATEAERRSATGIAWEQVAARLDANPTALEVLARMEASGGEPDVMGRDEASGQYLFCDCSAESPAERRSLCYDRAAWNARKEAKPQGSAAEAAAEMGVELLDEAQYRALQALDEFDLKTSSWLATPADVRALGGALFGDRRYGRVFVYHNGAQSYYAARGFRGLLRV